MLKPLILERFLIDRMTSCDRKALEPPLQAFAAGAEVSFARAGLVRNAAPSLKFLCHGDAMES
ncbi:hypothetical protein [Methylocapsa palsarum]|uniref:hypothetical protein n=1 Tax=Methylocapsa palsarum TaxID=1612308 RepID=UPI000B87A604|nr:hypothetical protein [Methylocapsa palsarum]